MEITEQIPTPERQFKPIYIVLHSEEEAAALWDLVQARAAYARVNGAELTSINDVCSKLHNYFSENRAKLSTK